MKKWKGRGKEKSVSKMQYLAHGFDSVVICYPLGVLPDLQSGINHLIYLLFLMISSALSFSLSKLNTL